MKNIIIFILLTGLVVLSGCATDGNGNRRIAGEGVLKVLAAGAKGYADARRQDYAIQQQAESSWAPNIYHPRQISCHHDNMGNIDCVRY